MKSSTKRALAPLAVAGALVLTGIPPASAQDLSFDFPVDSEFAACPDFTLRLDIDLAGREPVPSPGQSHHGRTITAGKGDRLTFTNLQTEKSVTVPTGGSVQRTIDNGDGSQTIKGTGFNTLIMFATDDPAGPSTTVYNGFIEYNVIPTADPTDDPNFATIKLVSHRGKARDICAELAS
ncbi:hypothetical protein [Kocuria rosea]|uniref:hypothetical protein n=1 Tax=Kocuria rosea TaxID=1275 RepID=UPI000E08C3A8|nr:hypothetical protein [Kocuria rosea]STX05254.1 Uncharacterised protein [Kocuria rosea]